MHQCVRIRVQQTYNVFNANAKLKTLFFVSGHKPTSLKLLNVTNIQ